jgi:hypothetical protein
VKSLCWWEGQTDDIFILFTMAARFTGNALKSVGEYSRDDGKCGVLEDETADREGRIGRNADMGMDAGG